MAVPFIVLIVIGAFLFFSMVKILNEYERGVIFRLGKLQGVKGPGLIILVPFIDKIMKISLRTVVLDVESQDIITRDNVSLKVNAVLYFKVVQPDKAVIEVENYLYATNQLAQTTLRSIIGQSELDEVLAERDKINEKLQTIIDEETESWGIKVTAVEVKQVDLPPEMQRAMARQAEAERDRRAKVINAEGEFQAAQKLTEAAIQMEKHPTALQLRYLQTLADIATENNSTTIFPIPIDLFKPFMNGGNEGGLKMSDLEGPIRQFLESQSKS